MAPGEDDATPGGLDDKPKRPTPTLELEAEVVEEAKEEDSTAEAAGETAAEEDSAAEAPAAAEPPEDTGAEAGEQPMDARTQEPRTAPPTRRSFASRLASFATHLAAGVAGGLAGVGVAAVGLDKLPVSKFLPGAAAPAVPQARLDDMQSEIEALKGSLKSSTDALDARLAKAEESAGAGGEGSGALEARLSKLEATLAAMGEGEGGVALPEAAALKGEIAALGTETEAVKTQAEELAKELASLRETVSQGGAAGESAPGAGEALDKAQARIDALEERLGELNQRQAKTARDGRLAARAVALAALDQAARGGEAYAAELDTVKALIPADAAAAKKELDQLEAHALTGVKSRTEITQSFPGYRDKALDAAAAPQSDALIDRLASRARSLVRVRPSGPRAGDSPSAVLARMEAQVKAGDLAKAAAEADALNGAAAAAMAPWVEAARARIALEREVQGLRRGLLGEIAAVRPAGDG